MPPMDCRLRRSPPRAEERFHHFLRPGALARLRDSKIIARSLRSAAAAVAAASPHLLPPSAPPPIPRPPAEDGGVPHFLGATRGSGGGLRYPLRKKLTAARGVVFLPPPRSPSPEAAEVFLDAFAAASSELVAAH